MSFNELDRKEVFDLARSNARRALVQTASVGTLVQVGDGLRYDMKVLHETTLSLKAE